MAGRRQLATIGIDHIRKVVWARIGIAVYSVTNPADGVNCGEEQPGLWYRSCYPRLSSQTPEKVTVRVDARHETLLDHMSSGELSLN